MQHKQPEYLKPVDAGLNTVTEHTVEDHKRMIEILTAKIKAAGDFSDDWELPGATVNPGFIGVIERDGRKIAACWDCDGRAYINGVRDESGDLTKRAKEKNIY